MYGSPSSAFSGSYFAYFYDYGFSFSAVGDLITPSIDLSSAVAPILYFQYADGGGSDNVDVQVSNADGSFSSVFLTPTSTSGWEEIQVDLSSYVGQSISIRFVGSSVYGSSNPSIDDAIEKIKPVDALLKQRTDENIPFEETVEILSDIFI